MKTNYHMHGTYCDGKASLEDTVRAALEKGFTSLGFSSHCPVSFQTDWTMPPERLGAYLEEMKQLKVRYSAQAEIYCGLEIDWIPGFTQQLLEGAGLDYTIGAFHFFMDAQGKAYAVDGNEEEFREMLAWFGNDMKAALTAYHKGLQKVIRELRPDIIAHLDVYRKNLRHVPELPLEEAWYREAVEETLQAAKSSGCIVEINTGGMTRGYVSSPYPEQWIVDRCFQLDIPMQVNSDAHSPENLDAYFDLGKDMLRQAGYTTQRVLSGGIWTDIAL